MNHTIRWLWRVTGRKKAYVLALTLIQGASGSLGVLYALLLRNTVDSAAGHARSVSGGPGTLRRGE